jgi:hypothetical protein
MLIPLALTSTAKMQRRLGRRWIKLHRLIYVIAVLGVWHFGGRSKKTSASLWSTHAYSPCCWAIGSTSNAKPSHILALPSSQGRIQLDGKRGIHSMISSALAAAASSIAASITYSNEHNASSFSCRASRCGPYCRDPGHHRLLTRRVLDRFRWGRHEPSSQIGADKIHLPRPRNLLW